MNEQVIFLKAMEIQDRKQREEFLDQACQGNPGLRKQVEGLLKELERSDEFLNVPAVQQIQEAGQATSRMEIEDTAHDELSEEELAGFAFLEPSRQTGSLGQLGHYNIQRLIGRGAFGIVFKAFDDRLHRVVAIKVLSPEMATTSPARKRFLREARATAAVRHENVVSVYAVEESPIPFLVMEYIEGKTLQQLIDETGPLEVPTIVRYGQMIARGLEAAHQKGLIHRDIKPANILIESGVDHVKLTDFGLARAADDASRSQSGIIAGTPLYMSPEQVQGHRLDKLSDLFSLGSVLYVMCTGRPPFRAQSTLAVLKRVVDDEPRAIPEIIPETPDWLIAIICRLHAKKPADRYQSADEVVDALTARSRYFLERKQRSAEPALQRKQASKRQRKYLAPVAVLLLLLCGLGASEATGVTNMRGTVIRFLSPQGTLVVEVDDPGVSVSLDGEQLVIANAGVHEIRLTPGQYQLQASKGDEVVQQTLVTVTKNGRQVVRVSREATRPTTAAASSPVVVDEQQPSMVEENRPDTFTNEIGMQFVTVPAGSAFLDGKNGLSGNRQVEFAQPFYMGAFEVTQSQWNSLVGKNPSHFAPTGGGSELLADLSEYELGRLPVENVSWFDIQMFVDALNAKNADSEWTYRLPTELEWEFACRGGGREEPADGGFNYYLAQPALSISDSDANVAGKLKRTTPVGTYSPNALGIYDLHGNVQEWCLMGESSPKKPKRGGSWQHDPDRSRASDVEQADPTVYSRRSGFRLVRVRSDALAPVVQQALPPEQRKSLEWTLASGGKLIVYVNKERITLHAGSQLPEGMLTVETLDLKGIRLLDEQNVENLRHVPLVTNAVFFGTSVDDAVFAKLLSFPGIQNMSNFDGTGISITDASLALMPGATPNLFGLILSETAVTAEGVKHLKEMTNAGVLLKECKGIDDEACRVLATAPRWVWLGLSGTSITDAGLEHLHVCKRLVGMDLVRCPVTEAGVKKLAAALPRCRIEWDGGMIEPTQK